MLFIKLNCNHLLTQLFCCFMYYAIRRKLTQKDVNVRNPNVSRQIRQPWARFPRQYFIFIANGKFFMSLIFLFKIFFAAPGKNFTPGSNSSNICKFVNLFTSALLQARLIQSLSGNTSPRFIQADAFFKLWLDLGYFYLCENRNIVPKLPSCITDD